MQQLLEHPYAFSAILFAAALVACGAIWVRVLRFRAAATDRLEQKIVSLVAELQAERDQRDNFERRFWEMHGIVERVLGERDEWKHMWRTHVAEHLEGQAMLEAKLVRHRQNIVRAVGTHNHLVDKHKLPEKPIAVPADMQPLTGPPVGQAEAYFQKMRELLMKRAPAEFDALMARDDLADEIRQEARDDDGAEAPDAAQLQLKLGDDDSSASPNDDEQQDDDGE